MTNPYDPQQTQMIQRVEELLAQLRAHDFNYKIKVVFQRLTAPAGILDGKTVALGTRKIDTDSVLPVLIAEITEDLGQLTSDCATRGRPLPARYALGVWWFQNGLIRYAKAVSQ